MTVQQQALRDLDQAWRNFFGGTHDRPTWRQRGQAEGFRIVGAQALRVRQDNRRWSRFLVPKVGWVTVRRSRQLPQWKSYRVRRDRAGRWHIAFAAIPDPVPAPGTGQVVGLDRGVRAALAPSSGEMRSPAGLRPKESERLLRLQRRLARAQRGSNRRAALTVQIARLKAREGDRRKDRVEQTSTDLAHRFDVIRVEALDVRGMTRSARGSLAEPERNVCQKAGLNRGILAAGWSVLVTRLEQKAPGRVEKINPAYMSQTCNALQARRPRIPREPSGVPVRGLWAPGQRRHQRSMQHRGRTVRDSAWRQGEVGPVGETRTSTCSTPQGRVAVGIPLLQEGEDVKLWRDR